jgi:hypothetical protein
MTTFYKKVTSDKGRISYEKVSEYDPEFCDSFHHGSHLVVNVPGTRMRKYNVDPQDAALLASVMKIKNELAGIIVKASEARPNRTEITPEQRAAWDKCKEAFGGDLAYVTYPSASQVVEAAMEALMAETHQLFTNPSVKKAWENFQLVVSLSK